MSTKTLKINKDIIKNPRITEKASFLNEKNIYVFNVAPDATKTEVKAAFKEMYKIAPVKVAIIKMKARTVFVRGKKGKKSGGKKAMVYLKKGDKIEIA